MKISKIEIPAADIVNGYAVYFVEVFIREYSWLLKRRYREFNELHEKLVKEYQIEQALLPPKKYFGNLDADYVERRRELLEHYLQTLLGKFPDQLPSELDDFLEAYKYDVCGVTYNLAKELFNQGDEILLTNQPFTFTPLQLYCITRRLELPAPTCDKHVAHGEIGNLYDFVQHLRHLKITGQSQHFHLSDNVNFKYDISLFKSLASLEIDTIDIEPFQGLCRLLRQLESLTVHHSIHLLKDVLVDDEMWEQGVLETVETDGSTSLSPTTDFRSWRKLTTADFSKNQLPYIDESVTLLPVLESLDLSNNCIENIEHLQSLSNLTVLDLSHNRIQSLGGNLNTKLGNITTFNLAGNLLENVDGMEKLYSLVDLNLSDNNLTTVVSVLLIGQLPCLEFLQLTDNPLTKESMYRVRVLTSFEERAEQITLDGQRPSPRELKKVEELLCDEQSFEIINLPLPESGTSTKNKHASKKVKPIDRLISLEGKSKPSTNLTESIEIEESDLEFRSRVEKIRELGGDTWLTMLDEIQQEEKSQSPTGAQGGIPLSEQASLYGKSQGQEPPRIQITDDLSGHGQQESSLSSQNNQEDQRSSRSDSGTFIAKVSGVGEAGGDSSPRLHFGFTCELEELVRNKLEKDENITSGTYMVEVESAPADQYEERMVGVDLCKGVILEIQIASGKTCARHKLDDISSVDILDIQGSYHIDIRDTYSKEWRRHRTVVSAASSQRDYRQVARYRMRSIGDAAELFVLLYKFITKKWESSSCPTSPTSTDASSTAEIPVPSTKWANPLGVSEHVMEKFFDDFLRKEARHERRTCEGRTAALSCHDGKDRVRSSRIHSIYQALHADFIDAGALRHNRSSLETEMVRLALWVGCLPYAFPEHELPVCLMMTSVNIFLFHLFHSNSPVSVKSLRTIQDVRQVMQCFYSMPIRSLNQVVIGMYDQGFRLEVRSDGARGTFTFLTRDSEKTGLFLEYLYESLGETSDDENSPLFRRVSFKSRTSTMPSFVYPDEDKLTKLKKGLGSAVKINLSDQVMLMYSIVRELPESSLIDDRDVGLLTRRLRTLIVMNSRIFLCDEDHVHWPLPSFVRAQPSTPQWVVTKWQAIDKIIGIDVFELVNASEFVGMFGLSLIFDDEEIADEEFESMPPPNRDSNCWNLVFRSLDEREQLQRSLAQVWKDNFQADLKVSTSKPRTIALPSDSQTTDLLGFHESYSSNKAPTPVGTPIEQPFKKTHKRVGSDSLPFFKAVKIDCFESLVALDRKSLDGFFHKALSQRSSGEEETLLHVLWTGCTPYLFPLQEIQVCVLLSNLFVYILADSHHKDLISKKRGVKLKGSESEAKKKIYFNFISIKKLKQVCVGLFDQTIRLEAGTPEETFTFVTRDFNLTSAFLECLNTVLLSEKPHPGKVKLKKTLSSIYDSQSVEADRDTHSETGVKFVYPCDDTLEILKDSIAKFSQESELCTSLYDVTILVYLLVFDAIEPGVEEPKTLVIMDQSLCLCIEDHVNYPLTLFATGLPENPQHQVWDVRDVATLSRVEFTDFNSCDLTLVFLDSSPETEEDHEDFESASMGELCVITHHIAAQPGESIWKIIAPTYEEKEKALSLICKLWSDIRGGALPVVKAKEEES